MDVYLSGKRVKVSDSDLLGEGGEARVYRLGGAALKLFHPPTDALGKRLLDQKLLKLANFPKGLPAAVMSPTELATDKSGRVIGYQMPLVAGAEDFGRLAQRKWRLGVLPNAGLTSVFQELHSLVEQLHLANVVVGDFNDGNVLFGPSPRPSPPSGGRGRQVFLIDADSMQFGGYPCPVGHERFLDPKLYGVDLSSAPRFDDGTDWYAFSVLLFQSLLSVHPFGGTHPKLATLLRRAEARHSLMKSDVVVPRLAVPPKVLPDDLLHWFLAVFEKDARQTFPASLLQLSWTQCTCGVEHARAVCPECRALGPLVTRQVLRSNGRCTARTAFETNGRVLHAAMQGGLRYLAEENGTLRREDGTIIPTTLSGSHLRFGIAGAVTWIADGEGHVEKWQGDRLVERAQTGLRQLWPVLATSTTATYRQEQAWLIEQQSGARVGQVLEGQTWLWTGERLGLGFYRAGGLTVAFLTRIGKSGLKQLDGITWKGRIIDADAVFDAKHALLTVVCDDGGKDVVHRWLIDDSGTVLARCTGGVAGHGAVLAGRVVLATDGGLVAMKNDSGVLIEAMQFPDTQPFVSAGDELLPNADGSLFVVGARDITQLTLT
ncbi:MAG: hypothetical protein Q8L48_03030 [Archangium sp.]|nr:hypothetical protein [Archangium sp.]